LLLALGRRRSRQKLDYALLVDQEGGFVTVIPGQTPTIYGVLKGWNLRADDLEQQSDETISFIASLV
jgi:hypothetical protein